jgi:hypothetical protein
MSTTLSNGMGVRATLVAQNRAEDPVSRTSRRRSRRLNADVGAAFFLIQSRALALTVRLSAAA